MCREVGLSQIILRTTYVTPRDDVLRSIQRNLIFDPQIRISYTNHSIVVIVRAPVGVSAYILWSVLC